VTGGDRSGSPLPSGVLVPARTSSPDATRAFAGAIATEANPGDVILLVGDLGAGKTTFSQGFGAALGITDAVTSPTFTLVRTYPVAGGAPGGVSVLLHADMYRLDRLHDIAELGLGELVDDGGVLLVEWGDVAEPLLGGDCLEVRIEDEGEDDRLLTVTWRGSSWTARAGSLSHALSPWALSGAPS
jgi:tRNA threonylcarbamoyladenosine biosynthesis protein TsaE